MTRIEWDKVDKAWIELLVSNREPEGIDLEYKESLSSSTDADKREFLADVSSFANAMGGDLIFGISEERDAAGKPTNIPAEALGLVGVTDTDRTRLESIIVSGCAPRFSVQLKLIPGFPNGAVLVIRVARSWAAPHMVTFQNNARFFARGNTGKVQLDVHQLRAAFAQGDSVGERIRTMRVERIAKVLSGQGPKRISSGQNVLVHLIPYGALTPGFSIDIRSSKRDARLRPIGVSGWNHRFNLDGVLAFGNSGDYAQLFRNGSAETLLELGERSHFSAGGVEAYLREGLVPLFGLVRSLVPGSPVAIFVSIFNVGGLKLELPSNRFDTRFQDYTVDRNELLLPEVVISPELSETQLDEELRPIYDAMWQSGGFERSPNYDDDGRPKRR